MCPDHLKHSGSMNLDQNPFLTPHKRLFRGQNSLSSTCMPTHGILNQTSASGYSEWTPLISKKRLSSLSKQANTSTQSITSIKNSLTGFRCGAGLITQGTITIRNGLIMPYVNCVVAKNL